MYVSHDVYMKRNNMTLKVQEDGVGQDRQQHVFDFFFLNITTVNRHNTFLGFLSHFLSCHWYLGFRFV